MTDTIQASGTTAERRKRVLDPIERSSEVLFGLIMVLTFTLSISAATAGRQEVREMLFGALGCNLAWGIVDGMMYLINTLGERSRGLKALLGVRRAKDAEEARRVLADALPGEIVDVLGPDGLETMRAHVLERPEPPEHASLHRDDLVGALGVFLLVFVSTVPVVIPFLLMRGDAERALRCSNGIAIVMLFFTGLSLGRFAFRRPWLVGVTMVVIGLVLVGITMALGG